MVWADKTDNFAVATLVGPCCAEERPAPTDTLVVPGSQWRRRADAAVHEHRQAKGRGTPSTPCEGC